MLIYILSIIAAERPAVPDIIITSRLVVQLIIVMSNSLSIIVQRHQSMPSPAARTSIRQFCCQAAALITIQMKNILSARSHILAFWIFRSLILRWRNTAPTIFNSLNPIPGFTSRGTYVSLSAFGVSDLLVF